MVKSILDSTIEYTETNEIDKDDIGIDATLYETNFYGIMVGFVLGNPKYTYLDKNIIYYPIYLVKNDEITEQIGLYELLSINQQSIIDSDGDIDLNRLEKPLLYEFTYILLSTKNKTPTLVSKKSPKWISKFMRDDNYDIIDTKYDGDCFFSTLKLALDANGPNDISIADMREILSSNATEDLFLHYKILYDGYNDRAINLQREIKNVKQRLKTMKTQMENTKDHHLIKTLVKQYKDFKETKESLLKEQEFLIQDLTEVKFMDNIENLETLKIKMKTQDYWADMWAIPILERELNLKTIIFSEMNYQEGDEMNILQCGHTNDTGLEASATFEPSFYVLVCYFGGYHYQMITYNDKKFFTYEEIPEEIKKMVVDKCLEKIAGPYSLIPEFKAAAIASKMASASASISASASTSATASASASTSATASASASASASSDVVVISPPLEELSSDLYDNATVFRFYSKSAAKPFPGKGQGELLGPEGRDHYLELAKIPDWRKKLDNFWLAEFKLDGHKWSSVEHYYQGSKFKKNNKEFYIKFSLDSKDSSFAKDPVLAKAAGGKTGKSEGEQVRPKNIVVDPDFFTKPSPESKFTRGEIEMETAMRAKFTQHADLKTLLLATKKAKLEHVKIGRPPEIYNNLMRIRRELHT